MPHARKLWMLVCLLAVLLALGWAGSMDAEEADRQAAEYCHNVHVGIWPDYESTYRQHCLNGQPRRP